LQSKQSWGHNPLKKCYGLITYNGIEYFSTILGHVIISRVKSKKFGKSEVCDRFCNSLLSTNYNSTQVHNQNMYYNVVLTLVF
jgi:hypothetical protein